MYEIEPVTSRRELDCGPTCLKMLIAYYGVEVDLADLITECGESIWGCTGADLLRVGRAHGLDMTAWRMDADELVRQDRPAIVWWRRNHWCVLCGTDEAGKVVVCNPDRGRYRMTIESFASLYSGVAITVGEPRWLGVTDNVPAGALVEHDGSLWRALTAIVRGEQVVKGTNAMQVGVADILTELESKE